MPNDIDEARIVRDRFKAQEIVNRTMWTMLDLTEGLLLGHELDRAKRTEALELIRKIRKTLEKAGYAK